MADRIITGTEEGQGPPLRPRSPPNLAEASRRRRYLFFFLFSFFAVVVGSGSGLDISRLWITSEWAANFWLDLQKWSKGKQKEKVNNVVLFDQATYDKLISEVPKYKLITPSILSDRLRVCLRLLPCFIELVVVTVTSLDVGALIPKSPSIDCSVRHV